MTWYVSLLDGRTVAVQASSDAEACRVAAIRYQTPALIAVKVYAR